MKQAFSEPYNSWTSII